MTKFFFKKNIFVCYVETNLNVVSSINHTDRLQLPFILINAPRQCRVHCEMLEDRSQYFFEFDSPFLINEDIELLRLMGLGYTDSNDSLSYGYESNNTNRHIEELSEWLPGEILAFYQETITGRNLECLQSASLVANHLNSRVIDSDLGFHEISIDDCPISLERDANSNKMAKNKCHNGVRGRRGDLSAIADETNEMEGIGSINTRYLSKPEQISIPDGRRRWRKKTDSTMKPSRKPRLKDSIAKHDKKSMSAEDMVNKKIVKKNHQDPLLSRVSFEQDLSFVMKGDMRPLKEVDCPDIFSFSDATIDRNLTRSSPYWLNDESFFFFGYVPTGTEFLSCS